MHIPKWLVFFDCIPVHPCVGVECIREMKARGIDWTDANALRLHAREKEVWIGRRLAVAAAAVKPARIYLVPGRKALAFTVSRGYLRARDRARGSWLRDGGRRGVARVSSTMPA